MTTQIDGVEITPEMVKVLRYWYDIDLDGENRLECLVEYLGKVQDFITKSILEMSLPGKEEQEECLSGVISIKDDLKSLIHKKPEEE
jgi:bacterioferritin (cytochrome b1)